MIPIESLQKLKFSSQPKLQKFNYQLANIESTFEEAKQDPTNVFEYNNKII